MLIFLNLYQPQTASLRRILKVFTSLVNQKPLIIRGTVKEPFISLHHPTITSLFNNNDPLLKLPSCSELRLKSEQSLPRFPSRRKKTVSHVKSSEDEERCLLQFVTLKRCAGKENTGVCMEAAVTMDTLLKFNTK